MLRNKITAPNKSFFALLLFIAVITVFSCSKEKSLERDGVFPPPNKPVTDTTVTVVDTTVISDTSFYTDITVDGKRTIYINGQKGSALYYGGNDSVSFTGITNDSNVFTVQGVYYYANFLGFSKYLYPIHDMPPSSYDSSSFNSWLLSNFAVGSYNYITRDNPPSATNTILLIWTDPAGKQWTTAYGSQAGSSFIVTKEEPVYVQPGGYIIPINITATFTCKLYDIDGNVKQLTNGRFRLAMWL